MNSHHKKIEFTIAGVQKAGTTALAQYLSQHERIYLPPTKELHVFRHAYMNENQLNTHIAEKFECAPRDKIWGDATPLYMYWPCAFKQMALHNPHIKIIISLRHPVARAYSGWSMEKRRGRENVSFSQSIREGRLRVENAPQGVHLTHSYVERGFYAAQIQRLYEFFPREQVFFLRSDQIKADHKRLHEMLLFLGVKTFQFKAITTNIFPSSLADTSDSLKEDFAFLHSLYADDLAEISDLTGLDVSDWALDVYPENGQPDWT